MATYICTDCGATFDEPKKITETHGFENPPYEKLLVCPECNSSDYDMAVYCSICGKQAAASDCFYFKSSYYCPTCHDEIPDTTLKPGDYGLDS